MWLHDEACSFRTTQILWSCMSKFKDEFKIIAEIGCNHEGSFEKAIELTHLAADAGADIVKYQSYTPERYTSADNEERRARVTQFALTQQHYLALSEVATQRGMLFMSTPLTEDWVAFLNPLCCAFKIASGDITFKPVIKEAAKTGKHIILSTGAADLNEIDRAVMWIREVIGNDHLEDRLTLMHCVSAYPTPIEEANILSIPFLRDRYHVNVGYSNHVIGSTGCLAAVALGATLIEVHFTDQKEGRQFRDHSLSFDATDLKCFIQQANDVRLSLGQYGKVPQSCEKQNIPLIRKGIIAAKDIKAGEILTEEHLMYSRPATEFSSEDLVKIVGKKVIKDIKRGYLILKEVVACVE